MTPHSTLTPSALAGLEAKQEGRREAINDCIGLLRKWFWATNKEARECEAEMRALAAQQGERGC